MKAFALVLLWVARLLIRAWYTPVLAFFGLACVRGAIRLGLDGAWLDATLAGGLALVLLAISAWMFHLAARQLARLCSAPPAP